MAARTRAIEACRAYLRGEVTDAEMHRAADAYRDAIVAYAEETGRKLPVPTRAAVLRGALG